MLNLYQILSSHSSGGDTEHFLTCERTKSLRELWDLLSLEEESPQKIEMNALFLKDVQTLLEPIWEWLRKNWENHENHNPRIMLLFTESKKVSSVAEVHIPYTNIVRGTHSVPHSTTLVVWAIIACLPYSDGKNWRQASTKAKKLKRHDAGDDA